MSPSDNFVPPSASANSNLNNNSSSISSQTSLIGDIYDFDMFTEGERVGLGLGTNQEVKSNESLNAAPKEDLANTQVAVLSVSEYCDILKRHVEKIRNVSVEGVISNFSVREKFTYFSLKDDRAVINCMINTSIIKKFQLTSNAKLEDGVKVKVYGNTSFYAPRGSVSIFCTRISLSGVTVNKIAYVLGELTKLNYYPRRNPHQIPKVIKRVAVITSTQGQAIRDVCVTIKRLNPFVEIIISPAQVQGEKAVDSLKDAIFLVSKLKDVYPIDVALLVRGGGSKEDLDVYNDINLNAYISLADFPIVSGVGHEGDYTVADYVVDRREATPTAAASIVNDIRPLVRVFNDLSGRIYNVNNALLLDRMNKVNHLAQLLNNLHPANANKLRASKLDKLANNLFNAMGDVIGVRKDKLKDLQVALDNLNPKQNIAQYQFKCTTLKVALLNQIEQNLTAYKSRLAKLKSSLDALNPTLILKKGYSITYYQGKTVTDASTLKAGDKIEIELGKGRISSEVLDVKP